MEVGSGQPGGSVIVVSRFTLVWRWGKTSIRSALGALLRSWCGPTLPEPYLQGVAMWRLGPPNLFDKAHPSGHYVLDTANPTHEQVRGVVGRVRIRSIDLTQLTSPATAR